MRHDSLVNPTLLMLAWAETVMLCPDLETLERTRFNEALQMVDAAAQVSCTVELFVQAYRVRQ